MGVYSRAYQEVIAGRTREDEQIAFYGQNKVALPPRVTNFNNLGGQTQPTLVVDHLQFTGVGKANNPVDPVTGFVSDNISAYNPNKIQTS